MPPCEPAVETWSITASSLVAMPGAGSDGDYARRAFTPLADVLGIPLIAVHPGPDGIVAGALAALDAAATTGPVVAAGISIGGCVAVHWAAAHPRTCAAVVAASPPWSPGGADGTSPAAAAARATADEIERSGVHGAIAQMRASSPGWLGDELGRSWAALGAVLGPHMREAAETTLPTVEDLRALRAPTAVVAVADDPVHPASVAHGWARLVRHVRSTEIMFDCWAGDPGSLGRAAAEMLRPAADPSAHRRRGQRP